MADETEPAAVPSTRFEPRMARRIALWGGSCAAALVTLAAAALSEPGQHRIQETLALVLPAADVAAVQIPPPAIPNQEIAELKDTVRALAADRERLSNRVATLERTLDDVTGSIRRIAEKPPEPIKPEAAKEAIKEAAAPPPVIAPPATISAAAPESKPATASTPPPMQVLVPLPPVRVASAPMPEAVDAPPAKADIGVDLGGANTPEALRVRWSAVKANYGPMLGILKPVMVMHERTPGVPNYRLVVGPLASQAAATALCARLIAARALCRPTTFNSQSAALL